MYHSLILSGGAAKGLAYIGVLDYLEQKGIQSVFKEYIGCSIGALTCLLFVLGYTSKELKSIFENYDLESIKDPKFATFFNDYGLDSGKKMGLFVQAFIKSKDLDPSITLQQLYDITRKNLIVVVTNVNSKQTEYLSHQNHPDLPVYLAVQMSMTIPFIFTPVIYNGSHYVDGGLTCNFPIRYYSSTTSLCQCNANDTESKEIHKECQQHCNKVLGFTLKEYKSNENIDTFDQYLYNVFKSAFSTIESVDTHYINNKISKLNVDIITIHINMKTSFDLRISNERKQQLYEFGYNAVKNFFGDESVAPCSE